MAFETKHIRQMIQAAQEEIVRAQELANGGALPGDEATARSYDEEMRLHGAVLKLRHAAIELESEMLEHFRGVPQD